MYSLECYMLMFFFFFQAEDGIRDHCVTGVQTCALPIYVFGGDVHVFEHHRTAASGALAEAAPVVDHGQTFAVARDERQRSEERRVGKECRPRMSPDN